MTCYLGQALSTAIKQFGQRVGRLKENLWLKCEATEECLLGLTEVKYPASPAGTAH
jgi:hypothetical protein